MTFLVVGLGNPGPGYAGNRHNVGAMVVDALAASIKAPFKTHKAQAALAEGRLGGFAGGAPGPKVLLAKPTSYMNLSGGPTKALADYFSVSAENVIVVHDELDIDFDRIRVKRGGGEGGHNGLKDISKALGTKDYLRVRVGIGRPPGRIAPADFVLRDFSPTERKTLPLVLSDAADAVQSLVTLGLDGTQQKFHSL